MNSVQSARGNEYGRQREQTPEWLGYLTVVIMEAALTVGLLLLLPYFPIGRYPIAYVLLTMGVAYTFSLGPAILSIVLGWFLFTYFFVPPAGIGWPLAHSSQGWAQQTALILGVIVVGAAMAQAKRSNRHIQGLADESIRLNESLSDEIDERKQAETNLSHAMEQLDAQRGLLEIVVANTPAGVLLLRGSELSIEVVNAAYQLIAPGKNMVGKTFAQVWPEVYPQLQSIFVRVLETGESYHAEDEMFLIRRSTDGPLEEAFFTWTLLRVRLRGADWGILITVIETTQRKKSEQTLRDSQRQLQDIIDGATNTIVFVKDLEGRFVTVNSYLEELLGMSREELQGKSDYDLASRDLAELYRANDRAVIESGKSTQYEEDLLAVDGRVHTFISTKFPLLDSDGRPYALCGVSADITQRKRAEEALRESETRLKSVIENLAEGLIVIDPQGQAMSWNRAALQMHGYSDQEAELGLMDAAMEVFEIETIDGEPVTSEQWPVSRLMSGEDLHDYQLIIRHKVKGWEKIFSYSGTLIRGNNGEPVMGLLTIRDVTERWQAEQSLRESEEKFRAVFEQAAVGMGRVDFHDARWIDVNGAFCQMLGYSNDEFKATPWPQITHPDDVDLDLIPFKQMAAGELDSYSVEKRFIHKQGHYIWARLTLSLVRDAQGRPDHEIAIIEDISDQKRAEAEIRQLNSELEQRVKERTAELEDTNKELEAFSYSVSHDLRAPLRAIDGFSSTLLKRYRDSLDPQGQDYLDRVRSAAQRMTQLIDDILALSRAGRAEVHRHQVDVSAIVSEVLGELRESQPYRNVEVSVQPDLTANADSRLLRIVFDNLLGNAWKFTSIRETAQIDVGAFVRDGEHVYYIKDNGAGFNPEGADRLFAPFQRLHTESEFPGTGIGLALVQRIIRRHGGRIWAESEIGKGATFYFTLGEAER